MKATNMSKFLCRKKHTHYFFKFIYFIGVFWINIFKSAIMRY